VSGELLFTQLWAVDTRWCSSRQQRRTVQGRFVGCLLGGAVGDALGAAVEFIKRIEILRCFGPNGIIAYVPVYGGLGTITARRASPLWFVNEARFYQKLSFCSL
jgi:hypothetical protein